MPSPRQQLGQEGENRALTMLLAAGTKLISRNFRCRSGEIDLIVLDDESLVFVEVRQRTHNRQGDAAASVNTRKQQRLIRAAQYFLLRNPRLGLRPCRFDVIAIDGDAAPNWIRDAFRVPSP
ncbi:MAG: YraN family protein [Acidithiobacillus sp.]